MGTVGVMDAEIVVEVLAVVRPRFQVGLDLARLALDQRLEEVVERPAGLGLAGPPRHRTSESFSKRPASMMRSWKARWPGATSRVNW